MVVGVALAAALVLATYALARELAPDKRNARGLRATRALLSIACAALRYHTADTMSHAITALAIAIALACALRIARNAAHRRTFFALGASHRLHRVHAARLCDSDFSDRCVSRSQSTTASSPRSLAMLPGVAFLLLAQHAATGHFFTSSQRAYYASERRPARLLPLRLRPRHRLRLRARRFRAGAPAQRLRPRRRARHDAPPSPSCTSRTRWTLEPLLLLVLPFCFANARRARARAPRGSSSRSKSSRTLPFYFDGNYPGGGARFYADVLPVEHVLVAVAVIGTLPKIASPLKTTAFLGLAASLLRSTARSITSRSPIATAARPMFEPERSQDAHVTTGSSSSTPITASTSRTIRPSRTEARPRRRPPPRRRPRSPPLRTLGRPPSWAYRFGRDVDSSSLHATERRRSLAGDVALRVGGRLASARSARRVGRPTYATGTRRIALGRPGPRRPMLPAPSPLAVPIPRRGSWTVHPWLLAPARAMPRSILALGSPPLVERGPRPSTNPRAPSFPLKPPTSTKASSPSTSPFRRETSRSTESSSSPRGDC